VDITGSVQDAADMMFGAEIRHVPVVEQSNPVGIVGDRDLQSYLLPHPEQIVRPDDA
jgi:CBS domain-containing protein